MNIFNININIDLENSKKSYKEKYLDYNAPKADQVEGQLFDKD
jgi:hypothetical protein